MGREEGRFLCSYSGAALPVITMRWCQVYITASSPYCLTLPRFSPPPPIRPRTLHSNDRCNVDFGYLLKEPPCTNTISAHLTIYLLASVAHTYSSKFLSERHFLAPKNKEQILRSQRSRLRRESNASDFMARSLMVH